MEEKIDIGEFFIAFEERAKLSEEVKDILESNLILLSPHEKSLGFSDLLEEIFDVCDMYIEDAELNDKSSEIEFRNFIEKTYFQIQKYFPNAEILIYFSVWKIFF